MAKMSDTDLGELVARRRDASLRHQTDKRSRDRREAQQFYRGDNLPLYGNSGDGLSTVVSRDLLEAVESMLPSLVKPFVAGDEVVRFDPNKEQDEESAKQATDYINYLFQNHNDAFRVIYDFMKDGLLYRIGVAKVVHEEVEEKNLDTYQGLDDQMLAALTASDGIEIIGEPTRDETGAIEVRTATCCKKSKFRVYVVAPEEFLFEERLASLREGRFFAHRTTKPVGDFIAMGLDKAKCLALKSGTRFDLDQDDRFELADRRDDNEYDDDLARLVTIDECYIRCDYDGAGVLGWRKVFMGANDYDEVLLNEEADDHPYVVWTPIPIPHKLVGMSVHDLVRDLQMQGTALVRETMNALYLANRPQREVVEGQVNFEDLLNPTIGGLVRVKAPGMVREIATGGEGVIQQSLQMMEQLASIREQRTGSTRYNQGMDANSLNKTATGISMIQNASTQRAELIARQFAESGMKPMFNRMLSLVCRHMNKGEVIKLRGKWVPMNPAEWRDDYDLSVTVGLGTGNRDQQVSQMMQLIQLDSQIIQLQGGANGPLLTMPNVYEKLKTLVEAMGHKGVENFYTDPASEHDGGQPQQDPGADQKAQQDAAAQADAQKFQAQSQLEMQKAQLDADTKLEVARIGAEKDIIIAGMQVPPELSAVQGGEQPAQDPPQQQQAPDEQEMPQQAPMLSHGMPGMPGDHYMPAPQGGEPDPNMPQAPIDPSMMS